MAKDASKKDPLEKAQRKLTKAQMELSVAQEEHAQARVRGKQEVEQARLRAAKWLTKTGKRVDRRAAAVGRAEERLAALIAEAAAPPAAAVEGVAPTTPAAQEPEASNGELQPLKLREQKALDALSSTYGEDGATASQWQAAARMSEATFLRARKSLTDRGLVVRNGAARRGARYRVQEPREG